MVLQLVLLVVQFTLYGSICFFAYRGWQERRKQNRLLKEIKFVFSEWQDAQYDKSVPMPGELAKRDDDELD